MRAGQDVIREAKGNASVISSYCRATGCCVDPIEKRPRSHLYSVSHVLLWHLEPLGTVRRMGDSRPGGVLHSRAERGVTPSSFGRGVASGYSSRAAASSGNKSCGKERVALGASANPVACS